MNEECFELSLDTVDLWIEALSDRELTPRQCQELIAFLDANLQLGLWRQLSIALLDNVTLQNSIAFALPSPKSLNDTRGCQVDEEKGPVERVKRARSRGLGKMAIGFASLFAAAIVLVSFFLGANWNQRNVNAQVAVLHETQLIQTTQVDWLESALQHERKQSLSLARIFPEKSALIEIDNSPTRATYLTDRDVPQSIIEGFVAAGYQVQVKPYQPEFATELMRSLSHPVLQVDVVKPVPLFIVQGKEYE